MLCSSLTLDEDLFPLPLRLLFEFFLVFALELLSRNLAVSVVTKERSQLLRFTSSSSL